MSRNCALSTELDIAHGVPLSARTTLELGGDAEHFVAVEDVEQLQQALAWARARGLPVTILGGGSNAVVSDAGIDGLVIAMALRGVEYVTRGDRVQVTAMAGEPWDSLVAATVERDLAGLECLSGIPGLAGATPIQNVGAYGQEVSQTLVSVRVLGRENLQVRDLSPDACAFRYRDSAFKRRPDRYVVLSVTFELTLGGAPTLAYAELSRALEAAGCGEGGCEASLSDVRDAVLALRARKSMLLSPRDDNRRSAGSFFTNPIVSKADAERVKQLAVEAGVVERAEQVPAYPMDDGRVKLAAGFLVEHAGFSKGLRRGAFGISSNHALCLVHHGGGDTAGLVALAREVRDGVRARFGVELSPEPVFLGFADGHPLS